MPIRGASCFVRAHSPFSSPPFLRHLGSAWRRLCRMAATDTLLLLFPSEGLSCIIVPPYRLARSGGRTDRQTDDGQLLLLACRPLDSSDPTTPDLSLSERSPGGRNRSKMKNLVLTRPWGACATVNRDEWDVIGSYFFRGAFWGGYVAY